MRDIPTQLTMLETSEEYEAFTEKFKPKKTTDDCMTPDNIYRAVLEWVCDYYGVNQADVVRPFYPGGDYERYNYAKRSVVVDNPPFSILTQIVKFYIKYNIKFFLFAPHLVNFQCCPTSCCHVIENVKITYENGANVNTSFVTNLDDRLVYASPELYKAVSKANEENKQTKTLPKYKYPANVLTSAMIGRIVEKGVPFELNKADAIYIKTLDNMLPNAIFGGAFLLNEKAAAIKTNAEKLADKIATERAAGNNDGERIVWKLSNRETEIVKRISNMEDDWRLP